MRPDDPVTQGPWQNANVPGSQPQATAVCEPEDLTGTEPVTRPRADSSASNLIPHTQATQHVESSPLRTPSTLPSDMPVPFSQSLPRNHTPHAEPLQIFVNSDKLICRGVAGNLEPALLSGHVVLNLSEATNVKDILLEFVGKTHIPADPRTSLAGPVIFSHRWSFLPDGAKYMRTIKEGRHVFPFQLRLDAALPASMICTRVGAGAEVYYKLRATAFRSTFSSNFHAVKPVSIIKAFSNESIEYTQSLEVESTWPGKLMYSIMIPHKAYAAGDAIPVLLRFTPTAKGVSVVSIGLELQETVTVQCQHQSDTQGVRTVCSTKFEIKEGKPVKILPQEAPMAPSTSSAGVSGAAPQPAEGKKFGHGSRSTSLKNLINFLGRNGHQSHGPNAADSSSPPTASSSPVSRTTSLSALHNLGHGGPAGGSGSRGGGTFLLDDSPRETPSSSRRPSQEDVRNHYPTAAGAGPTADEAHSTPDPASDGERQQRRTANGDANVPVNGGGELTAKLYLRIPLSATPTHTASVSTSPAYSSGERRYPLPLTVFHKVRFIVSLSNLDGHKSELRCALPVHILDGRLLREARAATRVTREILLGRRRRRRNRGRRAVVSAEQLGDAAPEPSSLDEVDDVTGDADAGSAADEDEDWDGSDDDNDEDDDAPIELPSYRSHVHDRVADAQIEYGNAGDVYVANSLTGAPANAIDAVASSSAVPDPERSNSSPASRSRRGSSGGTGMMGGNLPPLEFGEELRRSLAAAGSTPSDGPPTSPTSAHESSPLPWPLNSTARSSASGGGRNGMWSPGGGGSRAQSRANSRTNSRAPSPEPRSSNSDAGSGGDDHHVPEPASDSHTHGGSTGSSGGGRNMGIFHLPSSLKPLSSLSSTLRPGHSSSKSTAAHPVPTSSSPAESHPSTSMFGRRARSRPSSPTSSPSEPHQHRQRGFTLNPRAPDALGLNRVPSYNMSSRGFLGGGVPPLELYRDLPTYEQVESARGDPVSVPASPHTAGDHGPAINRSQSDMNLASLRNGRGVGRP